MPEKWHQELSQTMAPSKKLPENKKWDRSKLIECIECFNADR
jgi:hypothetical protein